MAIKVLRLIEYTYKDEEGYVADRLNWTMSKGTPHMQMRSAVLQPEHVEWYENPITADVLEDLADRNREGAGPPAVSRELDQLAERARDGMRFKDA